MLRMSLGCKLKVSSFFFSEPFCGHVNDQFLILLYVRELLDVLIFNVCLLKWEKVKNEVRKEGSSLFKSLVNHFSWWGWII